MKDKTKIVLISIVFGIYFILLISLSSALIITSVSTSPNTIAPGETADVGLAIKNNGENDLTDVSVNLDFTSLPLAPFNSGSDFSVDQLDSDKSKQANFQIIALNDAKSGIYKIPVHIQYTENDMVKTKQSLISVMVNSPPILDLEAEDGLFLKGQNSKVTLKLINKGLGDIKFLDVAVGNSMAYEVVSQKDVYIGDIDSNDFQTADFNMVFMNIPLNEVSIPVSVTYKDISNKEYSKNYDIPLRIYSLEEAQSLGLQAKSYTIYYILIIVTLILVFTLYKVVRRKKVE
ncbi:Uncharacterised protein [uncultured archaeon]|nr:Uncharacterised protein [uncultured archaeon]